jgi:hypothetical protein
MDCAVPAGVSLLAMKPTQMLLGDQLIFLKLVFDVLDLGPSVRCRQAVFAQIDEDHFLDRQNALAGDLVAHFTGQGDRGATELGGGDAQFDEIAASSSIQRNRLPPNSVPLGLRSSGFTHLRVWKFIFTPECLAERWTVSWQTERSCSMRLRLWSPLTIFIWPTETLWKISLDGYNRHRFKTVIFN